MAQLKSIEMQPRTEGIASIFLKSQFCAKPQWPDKSTDLTGKVAIVTGGSSGLGFHASKLLLSYKLSHVILAVRSVKKGEKAAATLRLEYPKAQVTVWELEMGSYDSVQAFARKVEAELPRLDIAILNAGLAKLTFQLNPNTGHEETIQVNYLSTILLAILLLPSLKAKSPSGTSGRLTIVGSGTAYQAQFPNRTQIPLLPSFDDTKTIPFDNGERYPVSKLLLLMVLLKLAEHVSADDVIVNVADPGFCKDSGLQREARGVTQVMFSLLKFLTGRTMENGASTYVDASVIKGKESHGCWIMDWAILPFPTMIYDPETSPVMDRLWDETMAEFNFAGALEILEKLRK